MNCWIWDRHITRYGYGRVKINRHSRMVHVLFYETLIGPIPTGKELHHICANKACCNPDHLMPISRRQHILVEPTALEDILMTKRTQDGIHGKTIPHSDIAKNATANAIT